LEFAVTNEQFAAKVAELEVHARRDPHDYRVRTVLLGLLGYAYMTAVVLLVLGVCVLALVSIVWLKYLGIKLFIAVAAFLGVLVRAIWVTFPPPEGIRLSRRSVPELHAVIDELRRALRAPAFTQVLITSDYNAGVVHVPQYGIFGGRRSYLLLGLPLMKSLSMDQFRAVVAHELGHLARGDAAVASWIYGQRLRWLRLMSVLEAQGGKGSFLFRGFINWYAPYFNAYSFPLARAAEYEADVAAAKLTSPRTAAEALTGISVVGRYLGQHFWPGIYRQADDLPQPAVAPFVGVTQTLASGLGRSGTGDLLAVALDEETTLADTHPALKDRLKALGESARIVLPAPDDTADRLLGAQLERITKELDERWHKEILPVWQERHKKVQGERALLAELTRKHEAGEVLTPDEANVRAVLTGGVGGNPDGAIAQLRALRVSAPDHPLICFNLGVMLLDRDDDAGMALVERTMELDENAIFESTKTLRDYCLRRGRPAEAQAWHDKMVQRLAILQGAEKERSNVFTSDKFDRHGLTEADLAPILAELRAIPGLRKAYFVRKQLKFLTHKPLYVVGFKAKRTIMFRSKPREAEVLKAIQHEVHFPGETLIICLEGENYWLDRKFRFMRGSRIL
jgi:Zn-dependent protease with chaperone function